jgi:hypothetical protein
MMRNLAHHKVTEIEESLHIRCLFSFSSSESKPFKILLDIYTGDLEWGCSGIQVQHLPSGSHWALTPKMPHSLVHSQRLKSHKL